jgi:hypothetical protein
VRSEGGRCLRHLAGTIEGKGDSATFTVTTVVLQKLPGQE